MNEAGHGGFLEVSYGGLTLTDTDDTEHLEAEVSTVDKCMVHLHAA